MKLLKSALVNTASLRSKPKITCLSNSKAQVGWKIGCSVHTYMTGPEAIQSATGNLYSMELVDEHTNRILAIPLDYKSHALPKTAGELKSQEMDAWLAGAGTRQEFSAPYPSAHIDKVERSHLPIMSRTRARCLAKKK
ncbi:hypothetical protein C8J57DRAFT_1232714 [Mycena rebaudengoi]|nr:hypothetical protein C8J57DRAFT_1232714 [Mycena rebaudengoi]